MRLLEHDVKDLPSFGSLLSVHQAPNLGDAANLEYSARLLQLLRSIHEWAHLAQIEVLPLQ